MFRIHVVYIFYMIKTWCLKHYHDLILDFRLYTRVCDVWEILFLLINNLPDHFFLYSLVSRLPGLHTNFLLQLLKRQFTLNILFTLTEQHNDMRWFPTIEFKCKNKGIICISSGVFHRYRYIHFKTSAISRNLSECMLYWSNLDEYDQWSIFFIHNTNLEGTNIDTG